MRRKREAACFNSEEFDKKMYIDRCNCTEEDWECDFGYYRKKGNGTCVHISSEFDSKFTPPSEEPPKNCKNTYEVS